MALTTKQKKEVNFSIMGYFKNSGFDDVVAIFSEESPESIFTAKDEKKYLNNLERKWRSIIRLNQKISELEAENETLQDELDSFSSGTKVNTAETQPKKVKFIMEGHREGNYISCLAYYPTAIRTLVASASEDGQVILWDFTTGRVHKFLKGHEGAVEWVAFNPSGTILASCGEDTKIILWDTETCKKIGKPISAHDQTVSCIVWEPSGDYFYSASRDKTIKKWQLEGRKQKKVYNEKEEGHTDWIKRIILSPDGKWLASAGLDQVITTWSIADGSIGWSFRDHENAVESICFSNAAADKNIIANLEEPADQKLANAKKAELKEDKGGMFLVSGSRDKTIRVWFLVSGVCVKTIKGHDTWVRGCLFHPSGRFLLSCSDDKSIRMWDLKKNFRVHKKITDAHDSFICCMDWNYALPNLVTGGVQGEIKVWECK